MLQQITTVLKQSKLQLFLTILNLDLPLMIPFTGETNSWVSIFNIFVLW